MSHQCVVSLLSLFFYFLHFFWGGDQNRMQVKMWALHRSGCYFSLLLFLQFLSLHFAFMEWQTKSWGITDLFIQSPSSTLTSCHSLKHLFTSVLYFLSLTLCFINAKSFIIIQSSLVSLGALDERPSWTSSGNPSRIRLWHLLLNPHL